MKSTFIIVSGIIILPLFVVGMLALFGIFLDIRVYIMLLILCPLAAVILWLIYRDMKRKIAGAKKK